MSVIECTGCAPNYIPDNQLGLFDLDGQQLLIDLERDAANFTLDLSDENARDGLNNIMTPQEIEEFFETST
jgi:hypothetical protein